MKAIEDLVKEIITNCDLEDYYDINDLGECIKDMLREANTEVLEEDCKTVIPNGTRVYIPNLNWQIREKNLVNDYTITRYCPNEDEDDPYWSEYELTDDNGKKIYIDAPVLMAIVNNRFHSGFVYVGIRGDDIILGY